MPKNVLTSAVVYGVLAWAVFAGLASVLLLWGGVLLPWFVAAGLVAGGVVLVRDSRASGDSERAAWVGLVVLCVAAVAVLGVF